MTTAMLPQALWTKIVAFLESGETGEIVISVKRGHVTGAKLGSSWQNPEHDPAPRVTEPTARGLRMLESSRQ